jgi:hypothetical protein
MKLMAGGKRKSICLKSHKSATRGVRLLDRFAIDSLMLELAAKQQEQTETATQQSDPPKSVFA